jgi:sigma-B regulation protein RsbU (phosphoserine phosphatase)
VTADGDSGVPLPEVVTKILDDFRTSLDLDLHVWLLHEFGREHVYPASPRPSEPFCGVAHTTVLRPREDMRLELELRSGGAPDAARALELIGRQVELGFEHDHEIRFFTYELSERYEEINLLYSISETLGSVLRLEDAARAILNEVSDVLTAIRGSLWVVDPTGHTLQLVASVGDQASDAPISVSDEEALTARVFREGRPVIFGAGLTQGHVRASSHEPDRRAAPRGEDSVISVPIGYSPPTGSPRTVGVINLMGRRTGERFSASDQKLLSAIASQIGAALENNRLIQQTLAQERVTREMELAHDLQMKLLPTGDAVGAADVGARVEPAESVGGDFYHLFDLHDGRVGVMIGDVSSHGFPAALIMALTMSAAGIYAAEGESPAGVLRAIDRAIQDELETTEMYLTLFYGVIDLRTSTLTYANAGHPHAFQITAEGESRRLSALDPPMGITMDGYAESEVPWNAGSDLLFLFTDGLSDFLAVDRRGNGERTVVEEVVAHRDLPPRAIVNRLFERVYETTPSIPSDDRTAVLVRV